MLRSQLFQQQARRVKRCIRSQGREGRSKNKEWGEGSCVAWRDKVEEEICIPVDADPDQQDINI